MDYKIQFFPGHDLVVERIVGEITLDGLHQKTKELLADTSYKPGICGVIDLREAHTHMSKKELQDFAGFVNESDRFKSSMWAIIGNDPLVIALSQVFQKKIENSERIGVFGTVDRAARFLKKPELMHILNE
jgi:hypothetical protein